MIIHSMVISAIAVSLTTCVKLQKLFDIALHEVQKNHVAMLEVYLM